MPTNKTKVDFYFGTYDNYNKLSNKNSNTLYFITDKPSIFLGSSKISDVFTYTLPFATDSNLGGIKTGYSTNGNNMAVKLDISHNAFVTIPDTFVSKQTNALVDTNNTKLNVGNTNKPVYFNNGVPVEVSFTVGKNVPADAVFTDHWYTSKNVLSDSNSGLLSATTNTENNTTFLNTANVNQNNVSSLGSSIQIKGDGATTVSAKNNVLTISSEGVNLTSTTKWNNSATRASNNANRTYAVGLDKDGKLAVVVPWVENTTDPDIEKHLHSKNIIGKTNASFINESVTTNGNVWLNHIESDADTPTSTHNIVGKGKTSVTYNKDNSQLIIETKDVSWEQF